MPADRSLPRGDPDDLDDHERGFVHELAQKVSSSAADKISSFIRRVIHNPSLSSAEAARVRDIAEARRFPLGDFDR